MPDDIRGPGPALAIADALSRLPLEAPDRSAWPLLAARLDATRRRPRGLRWPFAVAAAAAAVLALALVLPHGPAQRTPQPAPGPGASQPAPLQALMVESAQLETLLARLSADGDGPASALMLALAFEDQLREIDTALAEPGLATEEQSGLWQRRVALLREYASLRGTQQWVAVQGGDFDGALVATY